MKNPRWPIRSRGFRLTRRQFVSTTTPVPYELFIALRYLRAKRKQVMVSVLTAIAIGAVTAGVASLVIVLGMMTGFREEFQTKLLSGTSDINLLRKDGRPIDNYKEVEERLASFPHIRGAAATLYQQVLVQGKQDSSGAQLKGVDLDAPRLASEVFQFTIEGDPVSLAQPDVDTDSGVAIDRIILGRELAQSTGLKVGDVATILTPQGHLTPAGMAPLYRDFLVSGIFQSGVFEYDSGWCYVSLAAAERLSGVENVAQVIQMKVDDIYAVKQIGRDLIQSFGSDYTVQDWQELNAPIYTALSYEKLLTGLALLIVIGIAALNIISVLIMMVIEKQRDIAILKSMGSTRRSVMALFMCEGLTIGVAGIILGIAMGSAFCYFANSRQWIKLPPGASGLSYLPFHMHGLDILVIALVTLSISFVSTLYPAWSASRLDPVEALRYE